MKTPISYGRHFIDEEDIASVVEVMRHGWLTQGPKVPEFEAAVATRVGARHAVAVSNGTAALHIACAAAGVSAGDTVITSPNTFVASANCAAYLGATPALADIDPETLNLDPAELARRCAADQSVRAIIPVHFAGLPCDMPAIQAVASKHGACVIEDAAHALGATYEDGSPVGNCRYSDMTTFSFHPVKMITTGEGGLITTNSDELYRKLLRLRSHGINKLDDPLLDTDRAFTGPEINAWYYEMQELGFNYRLTDLQAALGISQLRKLNLFLERRRELANRYDAAWRDHPAVRPAQSDPGGRSAFHLYVVRIAFEKIGTSRHMFMKRLREKGIVAQVHYIPIHFHPYYASSGNRAGGFPQAESYYEEALSLPLHYALSDEEQGLVIESINDLAK
ncbi:MAG: UDP-4-amino-4,6-dideoxy-N-acetyl-beta-L-altrosamine transaminase [Burkholderiales bacterium]